MTEKEFLKSYDSSKYEKPSVTADMLVFTINNRSNQLELLLIKRNGLPFKDKWAIPGGFVNINETVEQAAVRELKEETGLSNVYLEQFHTFSQVDRDPRMRVISVANLAFVPRDSLQIKAGDDASEAELFEICKKDASITLKSNKIELIDDDLAFDHKEIILKGIKILRQKILYTDLAFEFIKDKQNFTIYEMQLIYEAVFDEKYDVSNFRRDFKKKYESRHMIESSGRTSKEFSKCPSKCYRLKEEC